MRLVLHVCQLGLILRTEAQTPDACVVSDTNRPPGLKRHFFYLHVVQCLLFSPLQFYVDSCSHFLSLPENSDITVVCGTEYMDLSIYLCPVYQSLYNESLMVLNNQYKTPECFGTADWSVDPPILKFRFPINERAISSCNNDIKVFFTTTTTIFKVWVHGV